MFRCGLIKGAERSHPCEPAFRGNRAEITIAPRESKEPVLEASPVENQIENQRSTGLSRLQRGVKAEEKRGVGV